MYETPKLQRFGTLQSMTLGGGVVATDFFTPATDACESSTVVGGTSSTTCIAIAS